jgi:diguanylate cyclase (GGDEF)-like protein
MAGEFGSVWESSSVDIEVSSDVDVPRPAPAGAADFASRAGAASTLPSPAGWTDGLTDTDGPRMWDRVLASEQARNARHQRTSAVVLVDVLGLEHSSERWGPMVTLQLFVQLARELARGIRRSDYIARIGPTRFGVLLTETDEILAINFVDRVKAQCRERVDPAANDLRLAVGWASPAVGGRLSDAIRVAEERLMEERRKEA